MIVPNKIFIHSAVVLDYGSVCVLRSWWLWLSETMEMVGWTYTE